MRASLVGSCWPEKEDGRRREQIVVIRCLGGRPLNRLCDGFQARQRCVHGFGIRYRAPQQADDLRYRHRLSVGIPRCPAKPQQKAAMANDAIARLAKAGEVNKQALLEEARDRRVQIGRLRELPQLAHDGGRIRRGAEEIWHQAKARCDLGSKSSWFLSFGRDSPGNGVLLDTRRPQPSGTVISPRNGRSYDRLTDRVRAKLLTLEWARRLPSTIASAASRSDEGRGSLATI